ncbi:MAG TPA: FtsX-like permease family protein [Solirubrobacteraceae bacterium]|nr:FtsX-like permease family protein [Solirubrobacteraceae bacterium]
MRPNALLYFYRRRLRVHAVPELLAGVGVAIGVALVLATIVASTSIAGSADEVVRAVVGPATLQLHARTSDGFDGRLLGGVERLPGVKQAAPLLEQTATIEAQHGRRVTVDLAGADTSLVVLDGLAHTLPRATLTSGGIGLSQESASRLGITGSRPGAVTLTLRGHNYRIGVSAVLGSHAFGALAQATVAVLPLEHLQQLAGLSGRVTRILVQPKPGREELVRSELRSLASGRMEVSGASQDVELLRQALRPSDQASALFATISALLGLLFAINALLLTVPDRRRAIADLCLIGAKHGAIVQIFAFQAICLGVAASLAGLLAGYLLSLGALHQSTGYLAEAFTLGTRTVIGVQPLVLAFAGGMLTTCLASAIPLLDLRRGGAIEVVYGGDGAPGNTLPAAARRMLTITALALLVCATLLFVFAPSLALIVCAVLALATVLMTPLALAGVLRAAQALTRRFQRLTVLTVALTSLRATKLRSLALAATGAVALFGSVALGGARGDLLRGIEGFAHSYSADASVWIANPGDNQAVVDFRADGLAGRVARISGVLRVQTFQGGFLELDGRRAWIIARPPGTRNVLRNQILHGDSATAERRISEGGWIAVSEQIAREHHTGVGRTLTLPTPTGPVGFRIAATTTNLAWSPGAIFIGTSDYRRLWATSLPTALGVELMAGTNVTRARQAIMHVLGSGSGLEVSSAHTRQTDIDALTSEGLGQLGEISTLLLLAAILAMAAALVSAIWQRRTSLAALRLSGVPPHRLRLILLTESALMLGAGCVTGAVAGIYGQIVIDGYLRHVTGFPVASLGASLRPLEILAVLIGVVLVIVTIPGWRASRVSPTLAFNE